MRRWAIAASIFAVALFIPHVSIAEEIDEGRIREEARPIARQYGAIKFLLQRGESGQANRYIHSMMLSLKLVEQQLGSRGADVVFSQATGLRSRKEFFSSLSASDGAGELFQTDGPCAYYWQLARDGHPCGERATHPNQRVR